MLHGVCCFRATVCNPHRSLEWVHHDPHFTDVETEAREVQSVAQDHSAGGKQPMFIPAPPGSLPMLGERKPPPHILTDSYDSPLIGEETKARGLGSGLLHLELHIFFFWNF